MTTHDPTHEPRHLRPVPEMPKREDGGSVAKRKNATAQDDEKATGSAPNPVRSAEPAETSGPEKSTDADGSADAAKPVDTGTPAETPESSVTAGARHGGAQGDWKWEEITHRAEEAIDRYIPTATRHELQLGRRLFHMINGVLVATFYNLFLTHQQVVYTLGTIVCVLYVIEQIRISYPEQAEKIVWLNRFFLRAEEQLKESASIPYAMGILLTILTFPKEIALVAIYSLAIADPLSAMIGIKFGRHKLPNSKKSFEGSGAFFLSVYFCALLVLLSIPETTAWAVGGAAFLIALFGTLFEALPIKIDDNLTIPLFIAFSAWVICGILGIPI